MSAPTQTPGRSWRSVPAIADMLLSASLVGISVLTAVVAKDLNVAGAEPPGSWWQWILVVVPALAVAFRRTALWVALPVSVIGQMFLWVGDLATPSFAPYVLIYTVAAEGGQRGRRIGIAAAVALSVLSVGGVFLAPDVNVDAVGYTVLSGSVAYILGVASANKQAEAASLASALAVERVQRDRDHERLVLEERQRIARELHDIVGHSLSVIAVQAEAADRVAEKNPQVAVKAVGGIASAARSSLAEVRRVLVGLRHDAEAELAPVPSLASIPDLVEATARSGMTTHVVGLIPPDESVGPTVGAGVYRIVQEALTNVVKHGGPGASAELYVAVEDGSVLVRLDDDGRGSSANVGATSGSGLTGMSERAEVLGGTFTAGPRPGGGFRVRVTLPVDVGGTP